MNVIGIDPSLSATGMCWDDRAGRAIKFKATDPRRLFHLSRAVSDKLAELIQLSDEPLLAVIEDLPTRAHSAGLTGQSQGVVRCALQAYCVPYLTVAPASLKKFATGSGRAPKEDMRASAKLLLNTFPEGWDDNVIDAWWLRQMGKDYLVRRGSVFAAEDFAPTGSCRWSDIDWSVKVA